MRIRWCVLLALLVSSGAAALSLYQAEPPGAKVLSVQLVNASSRLISKIDVQHGNANTQELISVLQLKPGDAREIGLNHQPGMGFSLHVYYADGEHFEMCVGKYVPDWFISEIITDEGLDEVAGRYR